jgi:ArsR family transcriptional regulator, lead/cadmium/zinc/bismuth-responsive transcriptional repressor
MANLMKFSKAFSDKNRVKILKMLSEGDKNVGTVATKLTVEENLASHHLRVLYTLGLLKTKKKGREVYYRLHKPKIVKILRDLRENEFFREALTESLQEQKNSN